MVIKSTLRSVESYDSTLFMVTNSATTYRCCRQNGEEISIIVQNIIANADMTIVEAKNVEEHARVECLNGSFPNLWAMHQHRKKAVDSANKISETITQLNEAIKLPIISSLPRLLVSFPPSSRGYKALHSRTSIINGIMQEFKDNVINMIGVYGMGGVEELHMGNCYIQWEVEGTKQCNSASLGELRQLNHLQSLHVQIQDILNMPSDLLIFGKLEKYKILIGDGWKWSWDYAGYSETSRTLKLNLSSTTITYLDLGIKMLLNGVEDLSLAEVNGVRNVIPEFNGEGFAQLKHLLIQNCVEIFYIIDSTNWVLPS
ncbi:unnamed protein product [Lupinus luteus]|uniref:Uncharacterized protein n=1 Tax=Lupinus luteus TaxID=3873 RepID=A0AAV1WLS4_LUPLU